MADSQLPVEPTDPGAAPARPHGRLRALSGLLILAGLALAAWQFAYWEPRLLPVRVIEVQGEIHSHSSESLQQTIGERLRGGILTADLLDLKAAAESVAWVGGASIRRVWPDRLQVRVSEHQPVARWNGASLVTAEGVIFDPRARTVPAGLPTLEGGDQWAPEAVRRYLKWRDDLMLVGQIIETLSVDERGAWRLALASGMQLELGATKEEERLRRFQASVVQLEAAGAPRLVDLRYTNGFSVVWRRNAPVSKVAATDGASGGLTKAVATKGSARKGSAASAKSKSKTAAKSKSQAASKAKSQGAAKTKSKTAVKSTAPAGKAKPSTGAASTKSKTGSAAGTAKPKAKPASGTAPSKSTNTKPSKKGAPIIGAKASQTG